MALNPQLFFEQIDIKNAETIWTAKNSCFSELVYNSSVLVLMAYSYKDVLRDLALDFVGNFSFEG